MVNLRLLTILLATLLVPGVAFAEGAVPRLHHAPISVSTAHQALLITGDIDHPELVKRAILAYRVADSAPYMEVEFKRGAPGPYVAEIPEDAVNPPEISYLIEIDATDGTRLPVFASRAEPQRVLIPEELMDARAAYADAAKGPAADLAPAQLDTAKQAHQTFGAIGDLRQRQCFPGFQ